MKKNSRKQEERVNGMGKGVEQERLTIGIDLGDRRSRYCVLDESGEVLWEGSVATTPKAMREQFGALHRSRVVIEVGGHSRWASQELAQCGHEVIVANPRNVKLITQSTRKNDRVDARMLARLGRVDPELLSPIRHRSEAAQVDLAVIRAREALVEARTQLINCVRGMVKATGERVSKCASERFSEQAAEQMPPRLRPALAGLLEQIEQLNEAIRGYDCQIAYLAQTRYPETARLEQVDGVGTLTVLTFVLTVEDPGRFSKSRQVGCYLGLRPKQSQSGESDPQLRITKTGDVYLRQLLVNCAHYILGPFGADCTLRRWGLQLAARGGKNAKKRAIVAVARKLAVLLHRLWVSGERYEPLRGCEAPVASQAA